MSEKWDRRYLELVDFVKEWSEDRSTHIGAVLVKNNRVISLGYNGFPMGVEDTDARNERPAKYFFYEHSERNSIFSAARHGIAVDGATLYTTGIPCADCARATIQSGVVKLVVWVNGSGLETSTRNNWSDSIAAAREMLIQAGVDIVEIER